MRAAEATVESALPIVSFLSVRSLVRGACTALKLVPENIKRQGFYHFEYGDPYFCVV